MYIFSPVEKFTFRDFQILQYVILIESFVVVSDRAIICTIHQPSAEVFSVFKSLLLLQTGGEVCYYGSVEKMVFLFRFYFDQIYSLCVFQVSYFELNGFPKYVKGNNIADYALDCSITTNDKGMKPAEIYKTTPLCTNVNIFLLPGAISQFELFVAVIFLLSAKRRFCFDNR